jgi:hypothetical protein
MQTHSNKLRQRLASSAGRLRGRFEYFSRPESSMSICEADQAQGGYEPLRLSESTQLCIELRSPAAQCTQMLPLYSHHPPTWQP